MGCCYLSVFCYFAGRCKRKCYLYGHTGIALTRCVKSTNASKGRHNHRTTAAGRPAQHRQGQRPMQADPRTRAREAYYQVTRWRMPYVVCLYCTYRALKHCMRWTWDCRPNGARQAYLRGGCLPRNRWSQTSPSQPRGYRSRPQRAPTNARAQRRAACSAPRATRS